MRTLLAALLLFSAIQPLPAQDTTRRDVHQMHALHGDAASYIAMLEDPKRKEYQKPEEVLTALNLKPGEVIADIGAGSGYFSFPLAERVGEQGRVYAVDVNPDMILHINRRIRDSGSKNVVSVLAAPDDPLLPSNSVDRVFICDTWHHIDKRPEYLALLKNVLKAGGQLVMIDFQKRELPVGPPVEMKIAREELIRQVEQAGFRLEKEHRFLPYQYFLIFRVK